MQEWTPVFGQPLPLFEDRILKKINEGFVENRGATSIDMRFHPDLDNNPTRVDENYLHLFDAEKYTRFKLIFY